jgi:hypothetical protein
LRAEVEQLRTALSAAEPSQGEVHEGLHGCGPGCTNSATS